jgi:hypothetical protein
VLGAKIDLRLFVGEGYQGEERPRDPTHVRRFALVTASGETAVDGTSGQSPAGVATIERAGVATIVYQSHRRSLVLEADKFEAYLEDHGLVAARTARRERKESHLPGREVYSRCAKTLVCAADPAAGGHDRVAGMPVEIVPIDNPYALPAGGKLRARVLVNGKAQAGLRVELFQQGSAAGPVQRQSDASGIVEFEVKPGQAYLLGAVHMIPAPPDAGADWESFWASLTFEVVAAQLPDSRPSSGGTRMRDAGHP